jgi:hypothetical protein
MEIICMFIIFVKKDWFAEIGTAPKHIFQVSQKGATEDANLCGTAGEATRSVKTNERTFFTPISIS